VITKGQERCLYVFTPAEFERRAASLQTASPNAKAVRDYGRIFFSSASDEVPDRQGRITIPTSLRTYAGLDRDCTVIGANTHVEIWDATAWEAYVADREPAFAEISEEVSPGVP